MASTTPRPTSRQPLPDGARLVYRGALFEVYQWEQELFDGSLARFEKIKRPDTAYVIPITAEGELLLVEQVQSGATPYYGLIGGRVEDNESPMAAASRELAEEAGLEAEKVELWDAFQFLPKIEWAIYVFVAKGLSRLPSSKPDGGEHIRILSLSFPSFMKLLTEESFGDVEVALRFLRRCSTPEGRNLTEATFTVQSPESDPTSSANSK